MDLFLIFFLVILLINIFLGIFVYLKGKKDQVNQFFSLIILGIGIWMGGVIGVVFLPQTGEVNKNLVLFIGRIPFFGASFLGIVFFYFSGLFPRKNLSIPRVINVVFLILASGLASISLFTDLILKDMLILEGIYTPLYGNLYPFWGLIFLIMMISGIGILGWKYKISEGAERAQIKLFFTGVILSMSFAITTNLILPMVSAPSTYWPFGPFSLIFLAVFTTYAIVKHHLMNIRVIATELLVAVVALILFIELLTSKSLSLFLFKLGILTAFSYVGYLLLQSVYKEIERRKELEKLDKAKSEFISIASHQLRAPLTTIKGYVSMLVEGSYGKLTKKSKESLQNVYQSNERLIRLVNDLLDISRIETGKIEMVLKKTSLENIISSIVEEMAPQAKKKNIFLEFRKPQKFLPEITIDSDKIRQVVLNLIDNAVKYTGTGGIIIGIDYQKSGNKNDGDKIIIKVKDTGEGIDKQDLPKLFESFSRGQTGSRLFTEGAGLGLCIARKFIELHGGKIWAESKGRGGGSAFYVELPIK